MNWSIIFKCDKASHICDKSQYNESTRLERLAMKLHHMMCKVCREHSALNSRLTNAVGKLRVRRMPDETRQQLKARIQQRLSGN